MLTVDSREPREFMMDLEEAGIPVQRRMMDVGDFGFNDKDEDLILVTRKATDLFTSVNSGHFQDELDGCMAALHSYGGGRLFWILEGVWAAGMPSQTGGMAYFKRKGPDWFRKETACGNSPKSLLGMQISVQSAGVQFLWTPDAKATVDMLAALYRRGQEGWPTNLTQRLTKRPLKWSKSSKVQHLMGLWPRLTERQAMALLAEFGTINDVISAARNETLGAVKGIGKQSVKNLLEVLEV